MHQRMAHLHTRCMSAAGSVQWVLVMSSTCSANSNLRLWADRLCVCAHVQVLPELPAAAGHTEWRLGGAGGRLLCGEGATG